MKFVIAAVVLTLAIGAQASWGGSGHGGWGGSGHGGWGGSGHGGWGGSGHGAWAGSGWGGSGHGGWGGSGHGGWGGVAGIGLAQGHAAAVVHAPAIAVAHGHGHGGAYIAKTRGAVHAAPLASHINSVAAINVAPAPGTH